jgi:hypothetical protein
VWLNLPTTFFQINNKIEIIMKIALKIPLAFLALLFSLSTNSQVLSDSFLIDGH